MSFVYCRGCGKQIHVTARACPKCGAPQHISILRNIGKEIATEINLDKHVSIIKSFLSGRTSQLNYLLINLPYFFICIIFMSPSLNLNLFEKIGAIITVGIFLLPFTLPFSIRRAHDLGENGFYVLWTAVPIYGLIVSFTLLFKAGQEGENKYGANPLNNTSIDGRTSGFTKDNNQSSTRTHSTDSNPSSDSDSIIDDIFDGQDHKSESSEKTRMYENADSENVNTNTNNLEHQKLVEEIIPQPVLKPDSRIEDNSSTTDNTRTKLPAFLLGHAIVLAFTGLVFFVKLLEPVLKSDSRIEDDSSTTDNTRTKIVTAFLKGIAIVFAFAAFVFLIRYW